MSTRKLLEASWRGAKQRADEQGALVSTPASFGGQILEIAGGDPTQAMRLLPDADAEGLPTKATLFFARVRSHLGLVLDEERGVTRATTPHPLA